MKPTGTIKLVRRFFKCYQDSYLGWENGRAFSSQGKVREFEQTGKVMENHTNYWKTQGISDKCYLLFFGDI